MGFDPRLPPENNVTPTHPLVEFATLLGGIGAAVVAIALVVWFGTDALLRFTPPSLEQRVFGRLWTNFADDDPSDPRLAHTRELLGRLAERWPENPYGQFHLFVTEANDPNAFALPGGAIGVTSGLLDSVESENELAFVLGHELGHFEGRHHLRMLGPALATSLVFAVLSAESGSLWLPAIAAELAQLGFAREQEREADRFAIGVVGSEYGHTAGSDAFLHRIAESGLDASSSDWLATHPLTRERIEDLAAQAAARGVPAEGELTALPADFRGE